MTRDYWVDDFGLDGAVLDPEYYDDAIIGVTTDGRAIYDWDRLIDITVKMDDISENEAIDWHEYNTLRSLPYLENSPVIGYFDKEFKLELQEH